jgi:hypothetical protein
MTYTQKAPEFLSTREAADLLRVTERSILNFRKRGRLPYSEVLPLAGSFAPTQPWRGTPRG